MTYEEAVAHVDVVNAAITQLPGSYRVVLCENPEDDGYHIEVQDRTTSAEPLTDALYTPQDVQAWRTLQQERGS